MGRLSLYNYSLEQLEEKFQGLGYGRFSARQVFRWAYKHYGTPVSQWSNVSQKLRAYIQSHFSLDVPSVSRRVDSRDGTQKFLLKLHDGRSIESVVIPAKGRRTLCLSSQVGCAMGCHFCYTGAQGLKRNLEVFEIVGQYLVVSQVCGPSPTNLVYMGQGEPLHNFDNVKRATEIFLEGLGPAFGQRRITLSTSGLVSQMKRLMDFPPVNVAISLHGACDEVRSKLMPINRAQGLAGLFEGIRSIPLKAHRRITYEYLLIKGVNDRKEDMEALSELLEAKRSKINLIPFNEYPQSSFRRPSRATVEWFRDALIKRGHVCTIRATMGTDVLAACGQLNTASS